MRGLGRLIALPLLLIALALQGLAPAQALAMPRDAFGAPICSARAVGDARRQNPSHESPHDCCAAACALAGLAFPPPAANAFTLALFASPLARPPVAVVDSRTARALGRPNARGPPRLVLEA
jgi:hypothetical protein